MLLLGAPLFVHHVMFAQHRRDRGKERQLQTQRHRAVERGAERIGHICRSHRIEETLLAVDLLVVAEP
jgi:hypothetical protein